jgi:hypothetical protein
MSKCHLIRQLEFIANFTTIIDVLMIFLVQKSRNDDIAF